MDIKKYYLDIVYNTVKLEGIAVTILDTSDILNNIYSKNLDNTGNLIASNFINGLSYISNFNMNKFEKYSILDYLKTINRYVLKSLHSGAGNIRNSHIKIGGTHYIPEIKSEFQYQNELMDRLDEYIEDPIKLFAYITREQIFFDGNKRTAILATNLVYRIRGENIFFIKIEDQKVYLKELLKHYETGNNESLVEFLKNKCILNTNRNNPNIEWN